MIRLSVITLYLAIVCSLSSCALPQGPVIAPNAEAKVIDQIPIHKNGCGPASLINAYRFGSPRWNAAINKMEGTTDKEKFNFLVDNYGRKFSKHLHLQKRYDDKHGINVVDLTDLANDFQVAQGLKLPKLKYNSLFLKGEQTHKELLKSTHKHLVQSMKKGLPPLLSLKTFAQRGSRWAQVYGHFVVLYEVPGKLDTGATSFEVKYIDPWGGRIKTGTIKIPEKSFYATNVVTKKLESRRSPTLEIDFPDSHLGRSGLKPGQLHATVVVFTITSE